MCFINTKFFYLYDWTCDKLNKCSHHNSCLETWNLQSYFTLDPGPENPRSPFLYLLEPESKYNSGMVVCTRLTSLLQACNRPIKPIHTTISIFFKTKWPHAWQVAIKRPGGSFKKWKLWCVWVWWVYCRLTGLYTPQLLKGPGVSF